MKGRDLAGGIALAAVLAVVGIVVWSMLNQPDPVALAPPGGGATLGELTGYVGRVDLKARTVEVSENLIGVRPVTMAVTDDTSIIVRDKRGGLGDLTKDLPVLAFYEVRNDVKYVTSIKVIADEAQAKVASPAPERASATFRTAGPPAPAPPRAAAPVAEAASPPPPPAPVARPDDTDAGDGSAAVDWLLKESRRR